jgi:hypothetical protein
VLGKDRQAALRLAFRVPDLSRVDALKPDTLFLRADGVAIDHHQSRGNGGKGCDQRVGAHNVYFTRLLV